MRVRSHVDVSGAVGIFHEPTHRHCSALLFRLFHTDRYLSTSRPCRTCLRTARVSNLSREEMGRKDPRSKPFSYAADRTLAEMGFPERVARAPSSELRQTSSDGAPKYVQLLSTMSFTRPRNGYCPHSMLTSTYSMFFGTAGGLAREGLEWESSTLRKCLRPSRHGGLEKLSLSRPNIHVVPLVRPCS